MSTRENIRLIASFDHSNHISKLLEFVEVGIFNMQKVSEETISSSVILFAGACIIFHKDLFVAACIQAVHSSMVIVYLSNYPVCV